jgi:hypothetical protein
MRKTIHGRHLVTATLLAVGALLLGATGLADAPGKPRGQGTWQSGSLTLPLHRGAAVPFETFAPALPSNCEGEMTLDLSWDEEGNWVKLKLKGQHVLVPHPSVTRTEGVNFFPNPFSPEPASFTNGRYQFWLISPAQMITFYYDPSTLELLGSQFDFTTPPAGAIPLPVPGIKFVSSPFYQPDPAGNVNFEWDFAYDQVVRGDLPGFAQLYGTFPPTNLCFANPYRYDQSNTRPYLSNPQPASAALSFSEYLRNGLIVDSTIEPPAYYTYPPLLANTSTYSGATVIGGGVPRHYTIDFDAVFMNNAPPIIPWPATGSCSDYYSGQHSPNINFCGP